MVANYPLAFGALMVGGILISKGSQTAKGAFSGGGGSPASGGAAAAGGYSTLIPKGTPLGRTDQGVDTSLAAGTAITAPGRFKVIGIIPNWYAGQPFVWGQLLDGPKAGSYLYAAEQIVVHVSPGQVLNPGDVIATAAATGTGQEFGWATASGQTLARATTGYIEGQPTAAGDDFHQWLSNLIA